MNSPSSIVVNALEYYDTNKIKYKNMLKDAYSYIFINSTNDTTYNRIQFKNKDNEIILDSRYEIVGVYNKKEQIWNWSWAIPQSKKYTVLTSRKLLEYGLDLPGSELFLKTELITSRFQISNKIQLDLHIALASYLSKNPVIYKYIDNKDDSTLMDKGEKDDCYYYYLFLLDY